MRLFTILTSIIIISVGLVGVSFSTENTGFASYANTTVPINTDPGNPEKNFSGYYVFDGKMFYYDQNSGLLNPIDKNGKPVPQSQIAEKEVVQESQSINENVVQSPKEPKEPAKNPRDLLDELPKEDLKDYNRKPIQLATIAEEAQAQGYGESYCKEWGSPFLKSKTYASKEECDNTLEMALDQALVDIDKYIDSFEKHKRALQINADYKEYKKLAKHKIEFNKAKKVITQSYRIGCTCQDDN